MGKNRNYFWNCLRRAWLIAPIILVACCPSSHFSGDGLIASESCFPFSNYSIKFNPLYTDKIQLRKHLIHLLPNLGSVVGFKVKTPRPLYCEQFKHASFTKAVVALRLISSSGQVVVQHRAALSDWIWGYGGLPNPPRPWESDECFLYSRALYFDPGSLRDLTLQIAIEQQSDTPVELTPMVKSYAVYVP